MGGVQYIYIRMYLERQPVKSVRCKVQRRGDQRTAVDRLCSVQTRHLSSPESTPLHPGSLVSIVEMRCKKCTGYLDIKM